MAEDRDELANGGDDVPEIASAGFTGEAGTEPAGESVRSRLRDLRAEIAAQRTLELAVPNYRGALVIRYRSLSPEEFGPLITRIQRAKPEEAIAHNCDAVIAACEAILVKDPESGELGELTDEEHGGDLIKFDQRLARIFGIEAERAREIVLGVFSPDGLQPLAVSLHGSALVQWFQGNVDEIDSDLLDF